MKGALHDLTEAREQGQQTLILADPDARVSCPDDFLYILYQTCVCTSIERRSRDNERHYHLFTTFDLRERTQ
jgi:hypothetical protein